MQARGTPQILVDKTSPMTGRLRVYRNVYSPNSSIQRGGDDPSTGWLLGASMYDVCTDRGRGG